MQYEKIVRQLLDNGRADIARIALSTPAMLFFLLSPRTGFEDEPLTKIYAFGLFVYMLLSVLIFLLLGTMF